MSTSSRARNLRFNGRNIRAFPTRQLSNPGKRFRSSVLVDIVLPTIDEDALADASPDPSAIIDNVLLLSVRKMPVKIEWGGFDDAFAGDELFFMLDGIQFDYVLVGATDTPPYIGELHSPKRLVEGTHQLTVKYKGPTGEAISKEVPITFDYTAPGLGVALSDLKFDDADDIPGSGITAAKFRTDANGDRYIWAGVSSYGGLAAGDRVHLYCNGQEAADVGVAAVDSTNHIEVHIYEAFLTLIGDTLTAVFTYKIEDRAGNISAESDPVTVAVQLSQVPGLVEPTVPAYDDDPNEPDNQPLINEADARGVANAGFVVVVPWNDGYQPGDQFVISLGDQHAGPVPLGPDGEDMTIPFPYAASQTVWLAGSTNGTVDQRVSADVTYTVSRNGAGAGTSPPHAVVLNLYQKAIDPDPETPVNERLRQPTVISASGQSDVIPVGDFGKDATIQIRKRTDVAFPPEGDAFEEGDTLRIYYGSQPFFTVVVPPLGDTAIPLSITLPAKLITDEGSGDAVPVRYEVLHDLADGSFNINLSPTKSIKVIGTDTQPGNGHLNAGDFPDKDAEGFIPEIFHYTNTRFTIPDYVNREPDDDIALHFEFYFGDTHASGETPYPGHDWDHTIKAGVDDPIVVPVPSTVYNLYGNADGLSPRIHIHAVYTVTKLRGDTTPVTSDQANVMVDCRFSDGPDA
jgi:hypothetical protein